MKNKNLARLILTLILAAAIHPVAHAKPLACSRLHSVVSVASIIEKPPFEQWLIWEQEANFAQFRKSRLPIQVPIAHVDPATVQTTFMRSASRNLRQFILNSGKFRWFKHTFNRYPKLPHFNDPAVETMPAYLTASRSVAIQLGEEYYTLKMGTNFPHGPKGEMQTAKAFTAEDIKDGINRMQYIEKVDAEIGLDPELLLAKEVAMVADKQSGEGYLFRDLSFMKSGNYYLPALSIPYVGREIAEINRMPADSFWKKAYAELLGRSKAKLLLRYAAQMETPNSQNMLIELDKKLKPTGRLVFRDISDTVLITGVAEGLGEFEALVKDHTEGVENSEKLQPFWDNSAWRFDEAGDKSFKANTLIEWGAAHDLAYKQEIEKALSVDLSQFASIDANPEFDRFMASPILQRKLKKYRESQKELFRRKSAADRAG